MYKLQSNSKTIEIYFLNIIIYKNSGAHHLSEVQKG